MLEINKIYNMDCVEGMKMLDDDCIDCVVTSPPYDNLRSYDGVGETWNFEKFKQVAEQITRVLKPGGVCVWIVGDSTIEGSETCTSFKQAIHFKEVCGLKLHDTMIWEKISPFTHKNRYIANFEYMFVLSKDTPKTSNLICDRKNIHGGTKIHGTMRNDGNNLSDVRNKGKLIKEYGVRLNTWNIPPDTKNKTGHPAVFPENLAADHIKTWTNEGDLVLDPFMGSGTTAVACLHNDRNYIGFEMNAEYWNISERRVKIEAFNKTGKLF